MSRINIDAALEEFAEQKRTHEQRNYRYYLNRQAVQGKFRWPRDWPAHIEKVPHNLCKPIVERFATYLMGSGFTWNLDRPNSPEWRAQAEMAEKILSRLLHLSASPLQWQEGAKNGAMTGRTIYKVYRKGKKGREHACFTSCQPDYFYPVFAADDWVGSELSTVYYSYPIDILEAKRLWGDRNFVSERAMDGSYHYDILPERNKGTSPSADERRIPVLEVWTPNAYAIQVGDITVYNGENPYKWDDTGEGFIPFVVIENVRNAGQAEGEADIEQGREINEYLNYLISRKNHVVGRWLRPTVVWEGAPQNYADILIESIDGGGAIPTRLGSNISLLAYDRPMPAVGEMELTLRNAILESAGMNEIALQGVTTGSVNTGPALAAQFQPVLSTVNKKRLAWEHGLKRLFAMLLQVQESIGDSKVLGEAVINQTVKSEEFADGETVELSGKAIGGLRNVTISWPGVLPKDDVEAARLEMEKASQGLQSIYTTLEKLGEEHPDDEVARIRQEANDPGLQGQKVAEQMRAQTPYAKMEQDMMLQQQQAQQPQQQPGGDNAEGELDPLALEETGAMNGQSVKALMRQLARAGQPALGEEGGELTVDAPELPLPDEAGNPPY